MTYLIGDELPTSPAGERFTHGTSARTPRHVLIARQMKCGSQLTPDSMKTPERITATMVVVRELMKRPITSTSIANSVRFR